MPAPPLVRRRLLAGSAALLAGLALVLGNPSPAAAVVTPLHGFRATVDGFTSWYGSYSMGSLGVAWCIDHGSRAPDPAFRYVPAGLGAVPADARSAMAWVLGAHGNGADRVGHAAVMLVLHDLMGARYPSGRLDLDRLRVEQMAGFGGLEGRVLQRARLLKADGLAHRHLRGPLTLTASAAPARASGAATVTVRLRDARNRPVPGITVRLEGRTHGTTGREGTWRTEVPLATSVTVRASAEVPRLALDAWAPTARAAQRVARPGREALHATVRVPGLPPSTTTTTRPPPTTTTTTTTTSTSTTSTTLAPTSTTTTVPAATPTVAPPTTPPPTERPRGPVPTLPRTGRDVAALVLLALGLLLLGSAAVEVAAPRE